MEEITNRTMEEPKNVVKDVVAIKRLTGVTDQGRLVAELADNTTVELAMMPENGLGTYHSDDVAMMAPIFEKGVLTAFERYREEETT